jgi:hypothetical protein
MLLIIAVVNMNSSKSFTHELKWPNWHEKEKGRSVERVHFYKFVMLL